MGMSEGKKRRDGGIEGGPHVVWLVLVLPDLALEDVDVVFMHWLFLSL